MFEVVAGAILILSLLPTGGKSEQKDIASVQNAPKPSNVPSKPQALTLNQAQTIIHKVEDGDTLDSISKKYYGGGQFWTTVWNDNPWIKDPRVIRNGWEIKIGDVPDEVEELKPELEEIYEEITKPSPTPTPQPAVLGASQTVQGTPSSFDDVYRQAGAKYGVPWEILYGIHHMETGGRDGAISSGYGTGAQGPLQFMPGTWASYGVDGNGDGNADINNATDAIYGAANFIAAHGGLEQGLRAYGGDSNLVYSYARSRGYNQ